ncbi:MAG: hypothetical protein H0U73_12475 [Tatlockia sp.]|nr:hypothetical protein [Tatlockia sp.]
MKSKDVFMLESRTFPQWQYDINESDSILVHIDPGKPKQEGRKDQPAQKGNTCHYYVMNYLRDRIGKFASDDMAEKRKIEKLLSNQRKEISKSTIISSYERLLSNTTVLDHGDEYLTIESIQLALNKTLQNFLMDEGFYKFFERNYQRPFAEEDKVYMANFISEIKNTYQFCSENEYQKNELLDLNKLTQIKQSRDKISFYERCFKEYHVDINEFYMQYREEFEGIAYTDLEPLPVSLNQLSDGKKQYVLHQMYQISSFQLNNIISSDWHPKDGIDSLISVIKECGPMIVSGTMGTMYYDKTSIIDLKIGEIPVKGFKPNSAKIDQNSNAHAILVIGVTKTGYEKTKSDLVYYIDPGVPQKVNSPLSIFVVSYNTFVKRIVEKHGFCMLHNDNVEYWNKFPNARFLFFRNNPVLSNVTSNIKNLEDDKKFNVAEIGGKTV